MHKSLQPFLSTTYSVQERILYIAATSEGKNLFHATAMIVYQRQPTIEDRTYLTEAQHPDSHLSSLSMAWLLCMNFVFTKVTLITVKAFQHFLFAQLTANLLRDIFTL